MRTDHEAGTAPTHRAAPEGLSRASPSNRPYKGLQTDVRRFPAQAEHRPSARRCGGNTRRSGSSSLESEARAGSRTRPRSWRTFRLRAAHTADRTGDTEGAFSGRRLRATDPARGLRLFPAGHPPEGRHPRAAEQQRQRSSGAENPQGSRTRFARRRTPAHIGSDRRPDSGPNASNSPGLSSPFSA